LEIRRRFIEEPPWRTKAGGCRRHSMVLRRPGAIDSGTVAPKILIIGLFDSLGRGQNGSMASSSSCILVAGCGVIGLSTAVRLAEAGHRVRIVARERSPHTTSDVAAAVWYPFRGGTPDQALRWSRRSLEVVRD